MYTLTETAVVIRNSDGANIPDDSRNSDWIDYQKWLKVPGNIPAPYVPPVPETPVQGLTATEIARLRAFLATQGP